MILMIVLISGNQDRRFPVSLLPGFWFQFSQNLIVQVSIVLRLSDSPSLGSTNKPGSMFELIAFISWVSQLLDLNESVDLLEISTW